ncbi:MAG: 2-C-methyl-D-erythritol 4-phosphate cytidylyltransferase, partial [Clostridia bacterium]|nr:2-C-methyl-D-erythritol 4-phosphate cytidylyltransferase [Clostridia bacterium]
MSGFFKKITDKTESFFLKGFKPFTSAVITVGGSGTRMQSNNGITKQFIEISGIPVVVRTLTEFQKSPYVDEIVIVSKDDEIGYYTDIIDKYHFTKVRRVTKGGKTRQESVLNGFKAISPEAEYVAIHDGVRCLITQENIRSVIKTAYATGSAAAATKIYDTL